MGSPDGVGSAAEHPQHRVSVAAFAMDVTEVTVADYARCVSAGACSQANADNGFCNYGKSDKASHPINCVDWSQATAYCGWAGKRLPTEEEWEYAARGTDGRTFPWGFSAPSGRLCWDRYKSKQGTCAVGSFPPALFGLRDMAGNVAEWTSNHYSGGQDKNGAIELRRARGGTWRVDSAALVRAAEIYTNLRAYRGSDVGFRCAR
jgi:formylglycine-generating enzyme required for sulfatase activity